MKRTWMVLALAVWLVSPLRAAINEVRVVAVQPDVQCHKAGTPEDDWVTVEKDTVLKQGDEISCDPDGACTLQFADTSTVVVKNTSQLKIASFFTEGGVVRTEILLKMGEVAAKVNKSEATRSDFRIKSPTGTASVRGTELKTVSYTPTQGMKVVLVSGFANLGGLRGNTQVGGGQTGAVEADGDTVSPLQNEKTNLSTTAYAPGSTPDEVEFFQSNVVVTGTGTSSSSASGTDEVASIATENVNKAGVQLVREINFNDGVIPPDFDTRNALVAQPGTFGPSSADGTRMLVIHTGGENESLGFAELGAANLAQGAVLDLEFDHNFITTEEPGQFFANDDEFTANIVSNGQQTTIVRHSVFSSTFKPIDPATLPAVMNLPGGTPPEVAFETGFQRFKGRFAVPAGGLEGTFLVRDGDVEPGVPDTIIESAAQIDNLRASLVQQSNGVTVVTPIGSPVGVGSAGQAQPAGSPIR